MYHLIRMSSKFDFVVALSSTVTLYLTTIIFLVVEAHILLTMYQNVTHIRNKLMDCPPLAHEKRIPQSGHQNWRY